MNSDMTVHGAKEAVSKGKRVSNFHFGEGEWVAKHWRDGYVTNEEGNLLRATKFWMDTYYEGWYVVDNETINTEEI